MSTVSLRDAKAGLSTLVDSVMKGEFVTITRHGKPVAAIVPVEAAEAAKKVLRRPERSLVNFLRSIPVADLEVDRNRTSSRDIDL
ncbi:type II toxin-antitoxin system Phd/YefM family antitoxin [Rhizobium terrae]|uniref:type II toxin-antitoxin system Phd/YefM family antitoxin n=1 Tax=Rhizobium terrae TaxID=2171756 RepID=UPI000E3E7889|nr:type II toxin-antitoxin system prevent-host-death family antitoxin [Rhizobium terrae]